jgi:NAD(P)-dependent dehydrogenase (short-subunit alcohol dehydrogenase family)
VPGEGSYVASKHAVIGLSKTAARESPGIMSMRSRQVCLSFASQHEALGTMDVLIENDMIRADFDSFGPGKGKATGNDPAHHHRVRQSPGNSKGIAQGEVWLLSDDGNYLTGQVLNEDGGRLA